jgi:3',5'-cyclic AMP phosphodiesterase CpdA
MPRFVWLTDLHLNCVVRDRFERLLLEVAGRRPDGVLLGGDVAEAPQLADLLRKFAAGVGVPVYFVLGNHDYYRGSIAGVRAMIAGLAAEVAELTWLPAAGVVPLTRTTALVGHGGWGDGRAADFLSSEVILNDYLLIEELRAASGIDDLIGGTDPQAPLLTPALLEKLHALGDEAADHFRRVLPRALDEFEHVYVLMHVPPFREACWYQGRISDDNWSPHFTCVAAGQALGDCMRLHPHRRMTVLCGHTHNAGRAQILPNLDVLTGGAEYGDPRIQQVFDVE